MKRFGFLFALACSLFFSAGAQAQTCNDPSGFVKSFGTFVVGDSAVFGPDCQHLQSGASSGKKSIISVFDFGATGNGITDDTAAINTALSSMCSTNPGGTLLFPIGSYLFNPPLSVTCPLNILGSGSSINPGGGTTLLVASGTATTTDIWKIGATNVVLRGITFRNFNVFVQGGVANVGRNVFHFDSTPGTTTGFAEVVIQNVMLPANVSAGGQSIFFNNGIGTNTNGGAFNVTVQNNYIAGGINFQVSGDTLRVYNNIITGANAGVKLTQVGGAGNFYAFNNNVTSTGGCYIIGASISPIISGGECEMPFATTEANNALIDIQTGAVGATITGGMIQNVSSTLTMLPIRNAGDHTTIGPSNRIAALGSAAYITSVAGATNLTLYPNFFAAGSSGNTLTDAGTGTLFVPGITTPTRAGDVPFWNGSAYVTLPGNNSGTNCFQENASGVPSWGTCGGSSATWTTFTSTVACGTTGTPAVASLTGYYYQTGKQVFFTIPTTIATSGTCAVFVKYSLPVTATSTSGQNYSLSVFDSQTGATGSAAIASSDTGNVHIFKYDGTVPTGYGSVVTGFYATP